MAGPAGTFVTDQYVVAAIGKSSREIPFIFCSDSPITDVCTTYQEPMRTI